MRHVFVSCGSRDGAYALNLANHLRKEGIVGDEAHLRLEVGEQIDVVDHQHVGQVPIGPQLSLCDREPSGP
jgi:hypothetical protein